MGAGLSPGQVLHEDVRGGDGQLRVWQGGVHQGLPMGVSGHQVGRRLPEDNTGAKWTWISDRGDLLLPGASLQYGGFASSFFVDCFSLAYF